MQSPNQPYIQTPVQSPPIHPYINLRRFYQTEENSESEDEDIYRTRGFLYAKVKEEILNIL